MTKEGDIGGDFVDEMSEIVCRGTGDKLLARIFC